MIFEYIVIFETDMKICDSFVFLQKIILFKEKSCNSKLVDAMSSFNKYKRKYNPYNEEKN